MISWDPNVRSYSPQSVILFDDKTGAHNWGNNVKWSIGWEVIYRWQGPRILKLFGEGHWL